MMTQDEKIEKYLSSDIIFEKINCLFIRMDPNDVKNHNQFLKDKFFDKLIDAMKKQSPLFSKTYQRIMWGGSFYKGTRIKEPTEYDLNFVINLFKKKDIEFEPDRPGFIKIRIPDWSNIKLQNTLNLNPQAYQELSFFIDKQCYLNQEKFRAWIEGILSKVAHATSGNNIIMFDDIPVIKIRKSGPAFTLTLKYGKTIDIDIVPVLCFSTDSLPSKYSKMDIIQSYPNKHWSVVPKPLSNSRSGFDNLQHRYWRLCFYEFEKRMLSNHDYGRMKPVIRQLKKLRNTQGWQSSVASYYLETLCYHELEMFHISQRRSSHTFLFFRMLEKLRDAFHDGRIKYYWDNDHNLLENIGRETMRNMEGRLENVLRHIKRNIQYDQYAIAQCILTRVELENLKSLDNVTISERETESEPESEPETDQGNCMIL
jgi:cyclic GMP-AMP synthase